MKWIGEIENRRVQLKNMGYGSTKIARILSDEFTSRITKDMVAGRDRMLKKKEGYLGKEINSPEESIFKKVVEDDKLKYFTPQDIEDAKSFMMINKIQKQLSDIYNFNNDGKRKKILSLSDIHAPYADVASIDKAIRENTDCDICVINGDLLDLDSMSSFDSMKDMNISDEFKQVHKILKVLNETFDKTYVVGGNHDYTRFARYIMKNIKPSLKEYAYDRLNPLKFVTEKYENIEVLNHNLLEIGDVIFKHPNRYSAPEMKTIVNEKDIMLANKNDLPNPDFRMIVMGHTHNAGSYYLNGVKLIEQGCLCEKMEYRFLDPVKRVWTTGYAVINLDENGKVDFNTSDFRFIK